MTCAEAAALSKAAAREAWEDYLSRTRQAPSLGAMQDFMDELAVIDNEIQTNEAEGNGLFD